MKQFGLLIIILLYSCTNRTYKSISSKNKFHIEIDTSLTIRNYNKSMLLGTNTGIFYRESYYMNIALIDYIKQLAPGIMRMPGGSWSDEIYWNGNKVRLSKESYIDSTQWANAIAAGHNPIEVAFDMSKYHNGKWDVDYTGYAPGFHIKDTLHNLSEFHGMTDILFLHNYIKAFGGHTMVTVNMGTGTPDMAAQWVKWTKNRKNYLFEPFDVKYWELGNELNGTWELGHYLPDGSEMNAEEYVRRFKIFAKAMKKADPDIKIGGSVASNLNLAFIEQLLKDKDVDIDFISFHAYPCMAKDTDLEIMIEKIQQLHEAMNKINTWITKYRPEQKEKIEIAITEWNIKVKEDITTVDLRNALWSAVWIGEMINNGVDIALQWDMFSTKKETGGGHGLFDPGDKNVKPHSQYWAMYLWSKYTGDKLLKYRGNLPPYIKAYVTKNSNFLSIMFINYSENKNAEINIQLPGNFTKNHITQEISFSKEQYQWDKINQQPLKSKKPEEKLINTTDITSLVVPPKSIKIIKINNR